MAGTCARCQPVPEYVSYTARVLKWSTIRVDSRTYSVPSRLIGVMVDVRLYPDHVEVTTRGTWWRAWSGYAVRARRHRLPSHNRVPGA